jgi:hypothetical protein
MEPGTAALPEELVAPPTQPVQAPSPARRSSTVLKGVGIVATGLVAGAIGIATIQSSSGTSNAASTTQLGGPAGAAGQPGQGGFQGGPPGGFGGRGGGVVGETRLTGTLRAVGTSGITVKAADGTATTVPVNGATEIVRNGTTAGLSALKAGDQVLVHVIPSGSSTVAERVFAGTSATQGPGFGGPPPGAGGQAADPATTGTASAT